MEANKIIYNRSGSCDVLTATGDTRIFYQGYVIKAPKILYINHSSKILTPQGAILYDGLGNVYSLEKMELKRDTGEVYALTLRAKMDKGVQVVASAAYMPNKYEMTAYQAVFSPCKVCASNLVPNMPLWQIRSKEVKIDDKTETMEFKKATLEVFGKPVFYVPYLFTPVPRASRRTGFLAPTFNNSSIFGFQLKTPFYYNIAPNIDITFTPTFSTKKHALHELEFRHLLKNGQYKIAGSATKGEKFDAAGKVKVGESYMGHINSSGDMTHFTDRGGKINLGFKVNRLLGDSKTYLKKYKIDDSDILNSNFYLNKSYNNSYLSLEALDFQDLRPGIDGTPTVLPLFRYYNDALLGDAKETTLKLSAEAFSLTRNQGSSYNKAILSGEMHKQYINSLGHIFDFSAGARFDGYDIKSRKYDWQNDGTYGKFMPFMQTSWKYPLIGYVANNQVIIQPALSFIASPHHDETSALVPEEVSGMEVNYSNLFNKNRFLDPEQVEFGTRLAYGMKVLIKDSSRKLFEKLSLFIGGSKNFDKFSTISNYNFTSNKDYNSKINYITHAFVQITQSVFLLDKLWLNKNDLTIRKHEVDMVAHYDKIWAEASYMSQNGLQDEGYPQEINFKLGYNLYQEWWLNFNLRSGLGGRSADDKEKGNNMKKLISDGIGLLYKGDCLHVDFAVNRDHTELRDLKPSVSYMLKISAPVFN